MNEQALPSHEFEYIQLLVADLAEISQFTTNQILQLDQKNHTYIIILLDIHAETLDEFLSALKPGLKILILGDSSKLLDIINISKRIKPLDPAEFGIDLFQSI